MYICQCKAVYRVSAEAKCFQCTVNILHDRKDLVALHDTTWMQKRSLLALTASTNIKCSHIETKLLFIQKKIERLAPV